MKPMTSLRRACVSVMISEFVFSSVATEPRPHPAAEMPDAPPSPAPAAPAPAAPAAAAAATPPPPPLAQPALSRLWMVVASVAALA